MLQGSRGHQEDQGKTVLKAKSARTGTAWGGQVWLFRVPCKPAGEGGGCLYDWAIVAALLSAGAKDLCF